MKGTLQEAVQNLSEAWKQFIDCLLRGKYKMINTDLETMNITSLKIILADLYRELEGCTEAEAKEGTTRFNTREELLAEIDWVLEMLEK